MFAAGASASSVVELSNGCEGLLVAKLKFDLIRWAVKSLTKARELASYRRSGLQEH